MNWNIYGLENWLRIFSHLSYNRENSDNENFDVPLNNEQTDQSRQSGSFSDTDSDLETLNMMLLQVDQKRSCQYGLGVLDYLQTEVLLFCSPVGDVMQVNSVLLISLSACLESCSKN